MEKRDLLTADEFNLWLVECGAFVESYKHATLEIGRAHV